MLQISATVFLLGFALAADPTRKESLRRLVGVLPGSGQVVCSIDGAESPCSGSVGLDKPGDYFSIEIASPESIVGFAINDADGVGGFFTFTTNSSGYSQFQDPFASEVAAYSAFSCYRSSSPLVPFESCEQPGRLLVDPGAPTPFYIISQTVTGSNTIQYEANVVVASPKPKPDEQVSGSFGKASMFSGTTQAAVTVMLSVLACDILGPRRVSAA